MQPSRLERMRRAVFKRRQASQDPEDRLLSHLFPQQAQALASDQALRIRDRRSDLIVAGLGIALGLVCALFPWYIFLHQEKFGVRALQFSGGKSQAGRSGPLVTGFPDGQPDEERDGALALEQLDPFATGALPPRNRVRPVIPTEQPFPAAEVEFRLVHVANGRAMIADDSGLWVVQRGSTLPDASRVARIEKRGEKWVLVTTADRILEITQ
ncbi:hypothetical protein [Pseudaminobacter sp. NGMCC 1.201702]|uniref:hypothetical protein n=1 Tax=Pseudaminobacter sp. NGMCC 1.201702 TaxID=3391825 RepID=UPI0039F0F531